MTPDEKTFEKTLLDLLDHPEKMKRMGEAALEVVRENQGATDRNIHAFEELVAEYGIHLRGKNEP